MDEISTSHEFLENLITTKSAIYDEKMDTNEKMVKDFIEHIQKDYLEFYKNKKRM